LCDALLGGINPFGFGGQIITDGWAWRDSWVGRGRLKEGRWGGRGNLGERIDSFIGNGIIRRRGFV